MATKAELEAELAALRAQLADKPAEPDPEPAPEAEDDRSTFDRMLAGHGIDSSELDALWAQFSKELGDFPTQKPLLTTIAAFGLGFALGRITKF
ncbi:hypothetical protein [Ruegeria jejuensis]|uniref:hypothetical protein n=1 Tax=Ruegeria jejuensis TaxID=3233338 RepID=UPI00355B11F6